MAMVTIGVPAHVDAGKTTPTERILSTTDAIADAMVSFRLNQPMVNLIDTPGHADVVAAVARSLRVPDGVMPVIASVEGVQPQTRRLARTIGAAGLPILIFINTVDRLGARGEARRFPCTLSRR